MTHQTASLPKHLDAVYWAERKERETREEAAALGVDLKEHELDCTELDPGIEDLETVEADINALASRLMDLAVQMREMDIRVEWRPDAYDAEKHRAICRAFDAVLKKHDRLERRWQSLKLDSLGFEPAYAFWPDPIDGDLVMVA